MYTQFRDRMYSYDIFSGIIVFFFSFLSISLFLGDGKQPLVDVVGAVFLLSSYTILLTYTNPVRYLPKTLSLLWMLLLGYMAIRTVFSISVGYSVSATIRYIYAYLVFAMFYQYSEEKHLKLFIDGLKVFTLIAIASSLLVFRFSGLLQFIPQMNLLYPIYGHNHLADILILALPIALFEALEKRGGKSLVFLVIVLFALLFTFSRAAILLSGVCILYVLFRYRLKTKRRLPRWHCIVLSLFTIMFIGFFGASYYISNNPDSIQAYRWSTVIEKTLVKPDPSEDGRIGFWNQAYRGFLDNPLFGNGPGTFHLLSKKYQQYPNTYSWFTHNSILEFFAENGIAGMILMGALLVAMLQSSHKNGTPKSVQLRSAIILTLLYSLLEFNIQYLIVWMLLWSMVGMFCSAYGKKMNVRPHSDELNIVLLIIAIFYVSSITSLLAQNVKHPIANKISFYVSPYNKKAAQTYLLRYENSNMLADNHAVRIMLYMHKKDPDILDSYIQYAEKFNDDALPELYIRAIHLQPVELSAYKNFSKFLQNKYNQANLGYTIQLIQMLTEIPNIRPHGFRFPELVRQNPHIDEDIYGQIHTFIQQAQTLNEMEFFLAKIVYSIGIIYSSQYPSVAAGLYGEASRIYPSLSYYAVERALVLHAMGNDQEAISVLRACAEEKFAAQHCNDILHLFTTNPRQIPHYGSLYEDILAFPFPE